MIPDIPEFMRDFSYPLNVYAFVIMAEEGQLDYLHYGLFDSPEMPLSVAQARSTEFLIRHISPSRKLLDVGAGIGTTLHLLAKAGFDVTGLTPDAAQVSLIHARYGSAAPVFCSSLEEFARAPGTWGTLLFQESSQYIDPPDLFESAGRLLGEDGEIIILDEFVRSHATAGHDNPHYLLDFLRLAEQSGFVLLDQEDLTRLAAPTLDWLLRSVTRHRPSLQCQLRISPGQLDALDASNHRYKENYANGRYAYLFLKFRRTSR